MKLVVRTSEARFTRLRKKLVRRGEALESTVETAVQKILRAVRSGGDRAVAELTQRFDGVRVPPSRFEIGREEMKEACDSLPARDRSALRLAARRIRAFHGKQRERSFRYRDPLGVVLGQEIRPLGRVGLYVPGGTAFYPSSVLMNAIPAEVAGVREVIAVTPPHEGGEPATLLAAAYLGGVDRIFRVGGAQAVAALAYGTRRIPRVDKIVGPGNAYVATAKRLVSGWVGIDMVAGPSEVVVVADASADPELVAADLLAQAEHGVDSTAVCLTPSIRLARRIEKEVDAQLETLPRGEVARKAMVDNGAIIVTRSLSEAVDLANELAPEHLELAVAQPRRLVERIEHAGAIFLGHHSPEAFGDYMAGPNHVLPTGGSARFASPLGVYDFVKRTSIIEANPRALAKIGAPLMRLAEIEGLDAHGAAVGRRIRSKRI